jgi:hypothetical protein
MEKRGGARKGSGRKPKADEQKLIEQLNPMHPIALKWFKRFSIMGG